MNEGDPSQGELSAGLRGQLAGVKGHIAVVLLVFAFGVAISTQFPSQGEELVAAFAEMVRHMKELGPMALILAIFVRNAVAVGSTMIFGLLFGLVPLFAALANGMLVGYVVSINPAETWKLIPHGIFELPAVFIGWGLGLWCGLWVFHPPRGKTLNFRLGRSLKIYITLILPLLAVAAIIEGAMASLLF